MTGRFIVFEGGEGTGKSTQVRLLTETLDTRGIASVVTREPGGTAGAEAIRSLLLNPPGEGWGPQAEAMLFAAARSDHINKLIKPAVAEGKWVLCDRYLDSSRAYQGGAGAVGDDAILTLHDIGSEGLLPDLTLLIDVPADQVAARLKKRDGDVSDAIGGRDAAYHAAVNRTFRKIAEAEPDRFRIIDGQGSIEEVHQKVRDAIDSWTDFE
ncbi:dTMP kinase [Pontixanthobacter sp.]|uniref:dTMP kinase n=1 Tax=Pontixanthobacter sp. TaxID=2792078 RepID=UPI003C7CC6F0